jgi:hypothetical protein
MVSAEASVTHCYDWHMGWLTKDSGFDSQQGEDTFSLFKARRLVLGSTQTPFQLVLGNVSGVNIGGARS